MTDGKEEPDDEETQLESADAEAGDATHTEAKTISQGGVTKDNKRDLTPAEERLNKRTDGPYVIAPDSAYFKYFNKSQPQPQPR